MNEPLSERESSEWVSLRVAADILGVHPATVRSWADRGELPSRRTTGGHRRFRRADLLRFADIHRDDNTAHQEVQLILQNALGKTRMQVGEGDLEKQAWYTAMSEKARQQLRDLGREAYLALQAYLANRDEISRTHATIFIPAIALGKRYAACLAQDQLSLPQALRGFIYFSGFITETILAWSEITALREQADFARLMREVQDFFNAMQLSIVEYYQED